MFKFSKSKTVVLKQKFQIVLIIWHCFAEPENILWEFPPICSPNFSFMGGVTKNKNN